MIKMNGLDEKPEPILEDTVTSEIKNAMPTYRRLLRMVLGQSKAKNGEEALDIIQIGLRLRQADGFDLSESDFRLMKKKVEDNELGLTAFMQGSLLTKLVELEEAAKPRKAEKQA